MANGSEFSAGQGLGVDDTGNLTDVLDHGSSDAGQRFGLQLENQIIIAEQKRCVDHGVQRLGLGLERRGNLGLAPGLGPGLEPELGLERGLRLGPRPGCVTCA